MRVWYAPYSLKFRQKELGEKKGFLVRIQTDSFAGGYGDCCPWPQLGDPSVEDLVVALKEGSTAYPILNHTLKLACWDGEARENKKWLLPGHEKQTHHFLTWKSEDWSEKRFQDLSAKNYRSLKLKLKVGDIEFFKNFCHLLEKSDVSLKLRLDFNGKMDQEWLPVLKNYSSQIEFAEDPYPIVSSEWQKLQTQTNVTLAKDFATGPDDLSCYGVHVCKPARERHQDIKHGSDVVFTSYLGHPVGQARDMAQSLEWGAQKRDYGLMSHQVYEANRFSQAICEDQNRFSLPGEYGIGFEDELKGIQWLSIT